MQDSPPGAAAAALAARVRDLPAGWIEGALERRSVVALYNARTATAVVPADEAAAYGTGLLPRDDAGLRAIVGPALPGRAADFAEPVEQAVAAIGDALDGRVLSRDDLHEELRARLPAELLPWCPGCESHHARRGLLVMASLRGRLCIAGRAGRQPAFARTDQWVAWEPPPRERAGAELVRRYLAWYGPSKPGELAAWAGIGNAHARELWSLVESELADGALLKRDLPRLNDPPRASGIRLVAPGDPLLLGRDRETLLPDRADRARVWRAIGGAGVVLSDGAPAGTWRARKKGRTLAVEVEPLSAGDTTPPLGAVQAEADRLAPHRGCAGATVTSG